MSATKPPQEHSRHEPGNDWNGPAKELSKKLRQTIEGEVRFDAGAHALYSTDSSNYRQIPIGVVVPKTVQDVVETVAICREFGAPVLSRGEGPAWQVNVAMWPSSWIFLNIFTKFWN
jgi:hypothetical protein